jgi:hypothetical protein
MVKEIGLGDFGGFKRFQYHWNTKRLFLEYHLYACGAHGSVVG